MIAIVAAVARNGVIGYEGGLPWELPDDLRHFRKITAGSAVVMGRTTFESIVDRLGHPLPDRQSVVLTHDENYSYPDVTVVHDPEQIIRGENGIPAEIYIIGGAALYATFLPLADRLSLTEIHASIEGDTYFPDYDKTEWHEVSRTPHPTDEHHAYAFDFVEYERCA